MVADSPANIGQLRRTPTRWLYGQSSASRELHRPAAPLIGAGDVSRVSAELDVWDAWPVQDADGSPAVVAPDITLWMALGSPRFDDPDTRHGHARIHLLEHRSGRWRDLGPAMPDAFSPGSREWSGSAVLDPDGCTLFLYFTATGRRGETITTFEQRLFGARATLKRADAGYALVDWRDLGELVERDPDHYMASDAGMGEIGTIKAFRDPAYFRDPATGREYLFFAGSLAGASSPFNGVVGAAVGSSRSGWEILPPIIDASGVNNELERPHAVVHNGLYYLFWSTQSHVFAPGCPTGLTGLYGMVSDQVDGDWRPLNGDGLVFANPAEAPRQAYSWLVLPDLSVISFIDDWGRGPDESGERRFGATFAPTLHLRLSGDSASLVT